MKLSQAKTGMSENDIANSMVDDTDPTQGHQQP